MPTPMDAIRAMLRKLRTELRGWSVIHGAAWVLIVCALLVIAALVLDRPEPGRELRRWLRAAVVAGSVFGVIRFVLARLCSRPSDASIALLIERHKPALADRLITAVELADAPHPFSPTMVRRTTEQAAQQLSRLSIHELLDLGKITKAWMSGALLALGIVILLAAQPAHAAIWYRRFWLLEDVKYPRQTLLSLIDFEAPTRKVARGRDATIVVEVAGKMPDRATLRYRLKESGITGRSPMIKQGNQRFLITLKNVLEPVDVQVLAGDDATDWRMLQTVEPPTVESVWAAAQYPQYTGLPTARLALAGAPLAVPGDTELTITIRGNKPITQLAALAPVGPLAVQRVDDREFTASLTVTRHLPIKITLTDADGLELSEPFPIDLVMTPDEAPTLNASLEGVRSSITRLAKIPVKIEAKDDFGIAQLDFQFATGSTPSTQVIERPAAGTRTFAKTTPFAVLPLELKPGDKLTLAVNVVDNDVLHGPHAAASETFAFQIVTPEELLALVASREVQLRQRFEQVVRELKEAKSELDSLPSAMDDDHRRLPVDRAVQAVRKNATETGAITLAFRDILLELANNGISNPVLTDRLDQQIIRPLDRVLADPFPVADAAIEELRHALAKVPTAVPNHHADTAVNDLVTRCEEILKSMRKLEEFNEAIAMLRQLLLNQEELLGKTKAKQLDAVKNLLD